MVDFHGFTVASRLGRGIVLNSNEEMVQLVHKEELYWRMWLLMCDCQFAGCLQLAREQAEKAAGLPLSAVSQPAVLAPSALSKPPASVAPSLSQSGITTAVATTPTPTLPVASTTTENAKLQ